MITKKFIIIFALLFSFTILQFLNAQSSSSSGVGSSSAAISSSAAVSSSAAISSSAVVSSSAAGSSSVAVSSSAVVSSSAAGSSTAAAVNTLNCTVFNTYLAGIAVFAGSTATNTGTGTWIGDLDLSPGTSFTDTGPVVITGNQHLGDATAATALGVLINTYNSALALTPTDTSLNTGGAIDIGGLTLKPGVYSFFSSVGITGTVTLNGTGSYIFQIPTTLITAAASHVVLINGARPCDILWILGTSSGGTGGSFTSGDGTTFSGSVLANTANTITSGSTPSIYNGRFLAINAAFTNTGENIINSTAGTCSNFCSSNSNSVSSTGVSSSAVVSSSARSSSVVSSSAAVSSSALSSSAAAGSSTVNNTFNCSNFNTYIVNISVLASTSISNNGTSLFIGDLDESPGTIFNNTGPGVVTGQQHLGDTTAANAKLTGIAAYNAALILPVTRAFTPNTLTDLGGMNLNSGVYSFAGTGSVAITGTLTLNGTGTYIFLVGTTLTTANNNSTVVSTNGARPCEIFWVLGTNSGSGGSDGIATLGTSTVFLGTIAANGAITMNGGAGATVNGRLLSINGAITFSAVSIVNSTSATCSDFCSSNSNSFSSTGTNTASSTSVGSSSVAAVSSSAVATGSGSSSSGASGAAETVGTSCTSSLAWDCYPMYVKVLIGVLSGVGLLVVAGVSAAIIAAFMGRSVVYPYEKIIV